MRRPKKCCTKCFWWKQVSLKPPLLGNCRDAIKRARPIIPFAVSYLEARMVYAHEGAECPCFKEKETNG